MITVVMASYLGPYPGSRRNPEAKFIRAVQSFLDQSLKESELIIVADGCKITERLYFSQFGDSNRIRFFMRARGTGWPGEHRQFAIEHAKYEMITYLDSDDMLGPNRLAKLVKSMQSRPLLLDSIYTAPLNSLSIRSCFHKIKDFNYGGLDWTEYSGPHGLKGTYQICHRKETFGVKWKTTGARGEDTNFINSLVSAMPNHSGQNFNVPIGEYLICHNPYFGFDV